MRAKTSSTVALYYSVYVCRAVHTHDLICAAEEAQGVSSRRIQCDIEGKAGFADG